MLLVFTFNDFCYLIDIQFLFLIFTYSKYSRAPNCAYQRSLLPKRIFFFRFKMPKYTHYLCNVSANSFHFYLHRCSPNFINSFLSIPNNFYCRKMYVELKSADWPHCVGSKQLKLLVVHCVHLIYAFSKWITSGETNTMLANHVVHSTFFIVQKKFDVFYLSCNNIWTVEAPNVTAMFPLAFHKFITLYFY